MKRTDPQEKKKMYSITSLSLDSFLKCFLLIGEKTIKNKEFGESDSNGSIMEKQKEDIHCLNE